MSPAPVSSLHRDLRFRLEAAARSREGPAWLLAGLAAVREIVTALRDRRAAREEAPHASA